MARGSRLEAFAFFFGNTLAVSRDRKVWVLLAVVRRIARKDNTFDACIYYNQEDVFPAL